MIADTLQKIVESTPGARGAILVDADGIIIDQFSSDESTNLESIAQEFSARLLGVRQTAESLDLGDIAEVTLRAANSTLVIQFIKNNMFVVLVLGTPGNLGKGRWKVRSSVEALNAEL